MKTWAECGRTAAKGEPVLDRFERKYERGDADNCWEWKSTRTKMGYGQFSINCIYHYAHRVSYQLYVGEIPNGMEVCHRCDNPACINPKHLYLGTHAENMKDSSLKGRARGKRFEGEEHGCAKLTNDEVLAIRASSETAKETAIKYRVSQTLIYLIRARKNWKHI